MGGNKWREFLIIIIFIISLPTENVPFDFLIIFRISFSVGMGREKVVLYLGISASSIWMGVMFKLL